MCYHTRMAYSTTNEETLRPAMVINLAKRNANPDEEREYCEEPGEEGEWDNERPYGWDVPEEEYPDW